MTPRIVLALAGGLLALPIRAGAAGGGAPAPVADPLSAAALGRMALGLLLVVALIFACAWVARRFGFTARGQNAAGMKIVGSLALGPRERVLVLEIDDTWLVVGASAGGMRTLHTLPARPAAAHSAAPAANGFGGLLMQKLKPAGQRPASNTDTPAP